MDLFRKLRCLYACFTYLNSTPVQGHGPRAVGLCTAADGPRRGPEEGGGVLGHVPTQCRRLPQDQGAI